MMVVINFVLVSYIQVLTMSYRNIRVAVREANGYCIPRGFRNDA